MAGETIYALRSLSAGGGDIEGAAMARITPQVISKIDPGDANANGPQGCEIMGYQVAVEIFGRNYPILRDLVGGSAADVAIGIYGATGSETITVKQVQFIGVAGPYTIPTKDGGTASVFGVRGEVNFTGEVTNLSNAIVAS